MGLLFNGAGVRTGGTFLTEGSVGAGLSAATHPALAVPPAAAQHAGVGQAGVFAGGAVAVLAFPASVTLAEPTVTLSMT